jgi:hypothetical protein
MSLGAMSTFTIRDLIQDHVPTYSRFYRAGSKHKTSALDWVALFRLPPIKEQNALAIRLWRLPARPFHSECKPHRLVSNPEGRSRLQLLLLNLTYKLERELEATPLLRLCIRGRDNTSLYLCAALVLPYCLCSCLLYPMARPETM